MEKEIMLQQYERKREFEIYTNSNNNDYPFSF